jgi:hypothetical protein
MTTQTEFVDGDGNVRLRGSIKPQPLSSPLVADLDAGGHKIVDLAAGAAPGQAATFEQLPVAPLYAPIAQGAWDVAQGNGTVNKDAGASFWNQWVFGSMVIVEFRAFFLAGTAGQALNPIGLAGGTIVPHLDSVQGVALVEGVGGDFFCFMRQNGVANPRTFGASTDGHQIGSAGGETLAPGSVLTGRFWYFR